MLRQICPVCGHVIFPHELCCPVCSGNDLCTDAAGYYAGSGDDDLNDMMAQDPDLLTTM